MVSSPLVKLVEAIALRELKDKLEPRIASAQIGFLTGLCTQVHILRLLGKVQDLRQSPWFHSGSWFILFVDFKSAFDKVNHQILFRKLEGAGISERAINILRMLYNSCHFSLMGDAPRKVGSGVAQGSLVSPLLYNWYVDDLVVQLSSQVTEGSVFAYADDIAVLCLGCSDVRRAVSTIEDWGLMEPPSTKESPGSCLSARRTLAGERKSWKESPSSGSASILGSRLIPPLLLSTFSNMLEQRL